MKINNKDIISLDLELNTSYKKKKAIIDLISLTGAKVSFILNRNSKLLVVDKKDKLNSYKCSTAFKLKIPVVHIDYFYKSITEGDSSLKINDFILKDNSKEKKFEKGIVTINKENFEKKDLIDLKKIKCYKLSEDDPYYTEYESKDYQVLKWIVFHEFNGNCEIIIEINSNNQLYRLRFETMKKAEHQIKNYYLNDSFQIFALFCQLTKPLLNDKFKYDKVLPNKAGSKVLQNTYYKDLISDSKFPEDIAELLNYIWSESIGQLNQIFRPDPKFYGLTFERLDKAELVLYKQKNEFLKPAHQREDFSSDYFSSLPFSDSFIRKSLLIRKNLNDQFELIQVLRDILNISEETNYDLRSSVQSIYRSIGCFIVKLEECDELKSMLMASTDSGTNIEILNIYEIKRPNEIFNFNKQNLDNIKLLFHGSRVGNLVGILSRGLLTPKNILSSDKPDGSDPLEMLGFGIYFSDSLNTSLKYSIPSNCKKTRFVMICEVALGKCKDYYDFDYNLTKAPDGFDSVHGVKAEGSKFEDSEYCVYDPQQCRIKYLIEIKDDNHKVENFDHFLTNELKKLPEAINQIIDLNDVKLTESSATLKSSDGTDLPLKSVHVRAQIIDMVSKVTIYQEYENKASQSIEAEYLFPLIDTATVCNFEAFIDDKHVIGICKEKEVARKEYKEAIKQGKGAYLIDQETNEIFKVNVGNLPAHSNCVIKITYISELDIQNEQILFRLPGKICQWKLLEEREQLQNSVVSKFVNKLGALNKSSFKASVIMPFQIRAIKSYTHEIKVKKTACQAVLEMGQKFDSIEDDTLILAIEIATIHMPRMFVEDYFDKDENKMSRACMVSFYPEFNIDESLFKKELPVLNIVIDCSNSLNENNLINLSRKLALKMLSLMPKQILFNVIIFGSNYDELFPYPSINSSENLEKSKNFIQSNIIANKGNTDFLNYIQNENLFNKDKNYVLISDGHITRPNELVSYLHKNNKNRIFTCSIGNLTNNNHLLKLIASLTNSSYSFYDVQSQSKWREKIEDLMDKIQQPPAISDIKIEWQNYRDPNEQDFEYCYAPNKINCLFNGRRIVAYGFMPNCQQAVLKATINGYEFETFVSCPQLLVTRGDILHKLTAKSIIDDWQNGILCHNDKIQNDLIKHILREKIIKLSKKFSITSEYTSFVAIEDRNTPDECRKKLEIKNLLDKDDELIEILPYMDYEKSLIKESEKLKLKDLKKTNSELSAIMDVKESIKSEDEDEEESVEFEIAAESLEIENDEELLEIEREKNKINEKPTIKTKKSSLFSISMSDKLQQKDKFGQEKSKDSLYLEKAIKVPLLFEPQTVDKKKQQPQMFRPSYDFNQQIINRKESTGSSSIGCSLEESIQVPLSSNHLQQQQQPDSFSFGGLAPSSSLYITPCSSVQQPQMFRLSNNFNQKIINKKDGHLDMCFHQNRNIMKYKDNSSKSKYNDETLEESIHVSLNHRQEQQKPNSFSFEASAPPLFPREEEKQKYIMMDIDQEEKEGEPAKFHFRHQPILPHHLQQQKQQQQQQQQQNSFSFGASASPSFSALTPCPPPPPCPQMMPFILQQEGLMQKQSLPCTAPDNFVTLNPRRTTNKSMKLNRNETCPTMKLNSEKKIGNYEIENYQTRIEIIDLNSARKFIEINLIKQAKFLTFNDLKFLCISEINKQIIKIKEHEFILKPLIEYIISLGLNSFGETIANEIKEMIIRLITLIICVNVIGSFKFETFDELKSLLLNKAEENYQIKNWFEDSINFVEKTFVKYPWVCDSLELGSNWNKFLINWFSF